MPSLNALGQIVKQKYPDAYGNVSDVELGRRVKAKYPNAYHEFNGVEPPGIVKGALDWLPAIGGGIGGAAGGTAGTVFGLGVGGVPGALGGAALGGAGGEAVKQLAERGLQAAGFATEPPETAAGAAGQIGKQGVLNAAYEAGGRVLGAGIKMAGKPLMELATRAGADVAATALNEGITATSKGFKRLMGRIGEASDRTTHDVVVASKMGQRYDGLQLAKQVFQDVYPDAANQPIAGADKARVRQLTMKFLGSNPASITPEKLHAFKQSSDQLAKQIYDRLANGQPVTAREAIDAKWHKAFADRARQTLEATIPDYQDHNATTQSLIKVKDAIWPAVKKETSVAAQIAQAAARPAAGATIGAGLGAIAPTDRIPGGRYQHAAVGAGLGALAGTPAGLSTIAQGTQSPLISPIIANIIRALGGAAQQ